MTGGGEERSNIWVNHFLLDDLVPILLTEPPFCTAYRKKMHAENYGFSVTSENQ